MKKTLLTLFIAASCIYSHGQAVPNGDFENWTTKSYSIPFPPFAIQYEDLQDWQTLNYLSVLGFEAPVKKVADPFSGLYAAKIQNIELTGNEGIDTLPGILQQTSLYQGNPNYLYGHYKSDLPVGEQGQIVVMGITKGTTNMALLGYSTFVNSASSYLPFLITLAKPAQIDSIKLIITSFTYLGTQQSKYTIGGYVQVDDINFSDVVTSEVKDLMETGIQVSPNPSSGLFTISNTFGTVQNIEIVNATGGIVYSAKINQHQQIVDLSEQPKGLYILHVSSNGNIYSKKLLIQ